VPKYVIDTNLYIRATRGEESNQALDAFMAAFAPEVFMHSIVALELLSGAMDPSLERRTLAHFIQPLERRGRVFTPSHNVYKRAGAAIAQLLREKKMSPNGIRRSFLNDCLLAASAREHGFVLITDNPKDFALLDGIRPMKITPAWPNPADAGLG
jgi:predicted nucleic acid-binding protein